MLVRLVLSATVVTVFAFLNAGCGHETDSTPPDALDSPSTGDAGSRRDARDRTCDRETDCASTAIQPSNAADVGAIQLTGLEVGPPNGSFDTGADCVDTSVLGRCQRITLAARPDVCVCRMDKLFISDLTVIGDAALVILASESVTVHGTLSVAARGRASGPGAGFEYLTAVTSMSGGAGGSFGTRGGYRSSADVVGTDDLIPLVGGMTGQYSCNSRRGGGGGGAIQIAAGTEIQVVGAIHAGGGGGDGGDASGSCLGGAGGGSGGAVLLEAPKVSVSGVIAANGGGGGGAGNDAGYDGERGNDARVGETPGRGGDGQDGFGCPLFGYASGGDGGAGSTRDGRGRRGQSSDSETRCIGGASYVGQGGGGGGAGRIRINTSTGCVCAGTFSPSPTFGAVWSD